MHTFGGEAKDKHGLLTVILPSGAIRRAFSGGSSLHSTSV
jgi:hypothetical protein